MLAVNSTAAAAAAAAARSVGSLRPAVASARIATGRFSPHVALSSPKHDLGRRAFTRATANNIAIAASAENGSRTASVTVAIKAGPRYELNAGEAHVLKNFMFKSTHARSALSLIREAELYGGVLSSTLTKEHLLLTAEFLKGDEDYFLKVLAESIYMPKFAAHEYREDVIPSVQSEYEQALQLPQVLGFDQLTQTAYRQRGLGASIFASPSSPVSHKDVVTYAQRTFHKDNIAVVASGIDESHLTSLVGKHFSQLSPAIGQGLPALEKGENKYFGGDHRITFAAQHSEGLRAHYGHYFIAFEGGSLHKSPQLAVLAAHLGGGSNVKWCAGLSPLSKIAESVAGSQVQAFNINFTDSGLIGAYIAAPHQKISELAKATIQAFQAAAKSLSNEDLAKAKAKARFDAATAIETRSGVHANVAGLLLNGHKPKTTDETLSEIEGVTAKDVSAAAKKALSSRATTVALGDVRQLPYADEIL